MMKDGIVISPDRRIVLLLVIRSKMQKLLLKEAHDEGGRLVIIRAYERIHEGYY